jgi:hypothetical protein
MSQPMPDQTTGQEQILMNLFQMTKLLADAFLGLDARFGALRGIICELHPELESRLDQDIKKKQAENLRQYAELLRTIELLQSSVSGSVH